MNSRKRRVDNMNEENLLSSLIKADEEEFINCSRYFSAEEVLSYIRKITLNELNSQYPNLIFLNKINNIQINHIERNIHLINSDNLTINLILNHYKNNFETVKIIIENFDIRGFSSLDVLFDENLTYKYFLNIYGLFQDIDIYFPIFLDIFKTDIENVKYPKCIISIQKFLITQMSKYMDPQEIIIFFQNYENWDNISGKVKDFISEKFYNQ